MPGSRSPAHSDLRSRAVVPSRVLAPISARHQGGGTTVPYSEPSPGRRLAWPRRRGGGEHAVHDEDVNTMRAPRGDDDEEGTRGRSRAHHTTPRHRQTRRHARVRASAPPAADPIQPRGSARSPPPIWTLDAFPPLPLPFSFSIIQYILYSARHQLPVPRSTLSLCSAHHSEHILLRLSTPKKRPCRFPPPPFPSPARHISYSLVSRRLAALTADRLRRPDQ